MTSKIIKFGSYSFNGDGVIQQSVQNGLERKNEWMKERTAWDAR